MLPKMLTDEKYKEVLINSLNTAIDMLQGNSKLFSVILPEELNAEYLDKNESVVSRLSHIVSKVENDNMNFNPYETSFINRAISEYIDRLELSQSHLIYMVEDVDIENVQSMKNAIEEAFISHMRFNAECLENRIERNINSEPTFNKDIILKALSNAERYVNSNSEELEFILNDLDIKQDYTEKNNMALHAIKMTKYDIENGSSLNPAAVSIVNRAMNQYIQKLETAQSNILYTMDGLSDLNHFKEKIKEVHFEVFKFNESYPLPSMSLGLMNRPRPPRP